MRLLGAAGFIALAYAALARSSPVIHAALACGIVSYGAYTLFLRNRAGLALGLPLEPLASGLVCALLAAALAFRLAGTRRQNAGIEGGLVAVHVDAYEVPAVSRGTPTPLADRGPTSGAGHFQGRFSRPFLKTI